VLADKDKGESQDAQHAIDDVFKMSLEELSNVKIYTSSRYDVEFNKTHSIITVITREQIKRRGYLNLEDALKHVPGFFPTRGDRTVRLGNRGFVQTNALNYLLLIDGHPYNSDSSFGLNNQQLLIDLNNIKKIEVVRTASSTLWGNLAGMGIIHLFTRTASDIAGDPKQATHFNVNGHYEFLQDRYFANFSYGRDFSSQSGIAISYSNLASDAEWLNYFLARADGPQDNTGRVNNSEDIEDSHDLHVKGFIKDWEFLGHYTEHTTGLVFDSSLDRSREAFIHTNNKWVEARYKPEFSATLRGEFKLSYGENQYEQEQTRRNDGEPLAGTILNDDAITTEGILIVKGDKSVWLSGLYSKQSHVAQTEYRGVLRGKPLDRTSYQEYAVFSELNYEFDDDLHLLAGLRYDYNSLLKDDNFSFLPRLGFLYQMSPHWSTLYSFNTGLIRPPPLTLFG